MFTEFVFAQEPNVQSGSDWLRLVAESHDMNSRKIPAYSVSIKQHCREIRDGEVIDDRLETYDCKFSGDLFYTKMVEQKVLKTSKTIYPMKNQTLYDGRSFFSYDITDIGESNAGNNRFFHLVKEYADQAFGDTQNFRHPLECIRDIEERSISDVMKNLLSNKNFQVKRVTKSNDGKVVVDAQFLGFTDLNHYVIDTAQGNLLAKMEAWRLGSKEPDSVHEWQYKAKDNYFLPVRFVYRSFELGVHYEKEMEYGEYIPIDVNDKTFTKEALNYPMGTRYALSKPGVPIEIIHIGGVDE